MVNMKKLNMRFGGIAVRYKDLVLFIKETVEGFLAEVYQPIETEEETGLDFCELRLEKLNCSTACYETEGEAILAAIQGGNKNDTN